MMATPIEIPPIGQIKKDGNSDSDIGSGSSGSGSGNNSPTIGTSFFGRTSPRAKGGITSCQAPPSPATIKRLLRIRKMSEMCKTTESGNFTTIPTQLADINHEWAKIII